MKWHTSSVFQSSGGRAASARPSASSNPGTASAGSMPPAQAAGPATILIADDDKSIRTVLTQALGRLGHHVRSTGNGTTLWKWVQEGAGDLVITDVMMPDSNGLDLLPQIRHIRPDLKILVMSAQNTLMTAVTATERGAFEYLPKPFDLKELTATVDQALAAKFAHPLKKPDPGASLDASAAAEDFPMAGRSPPMQEVYRIIARVVSVPMNVLIDGEPGTGKELVARTIHHLSGGQAENFIVANLGGLTEDRFEQTLFGSDSDGNGASGLLDQAAGGTLFFDEVGDLPHWAQARLLTVLQQNGFSRPGSGQVIPLTCRIISATHRDLATMAGEGHFRQDLIYRLEELRLRLPPLRERLEDIPELVDHFLTRYQAPTVDGSHRRAINDAAKDLMATYSWPGNVREIENFVKRLLVLYSQAEIDQSLVLKEMEILTQTIASPIPQMTPVAALAATGAASPASLPHTALGLGGSPNDLVANGSLSQSIAAHLSDYFLMHGDDLPPPGLYHRLLKELERPLFQECLQATNGNQIKTAELLGLNRNTVRKKLRDLEIDVVRGVGTSTKR